MASTSHDHNALETCMVQLVCGSPFKQGLKAINPHRSFLDVLESLEWSKGCSLVRVELCKSLTDAALPYHVDNLHTPVKCEIESLASLARVTLTAIRFPVRKQAPTNGVAATQEVHPLSPWQQCGISPSIQRCYNVACCFMVCLCFT